VIKNRKVTPWFPVSINPARMGVYQIRTNYGGVRYSVWDGVQWLCTTFNIERAVPVGYKYGRSNDMYCKGYTPEWRGLAVQP